MILKYYNNPVKMCMEITTLSVINVMGIFCFLKQTTVSGELELSVLVLHSFLITSKVEPLLLTQ